MNFLKDPRTNWKYILIIVILAAIVAGGILVYSRFYTIPETYTPPSLTPQTFSSQEECEEKTGCECDIFLCDYKCPKDFKKGWRCARTKQYEAPQEPYIQVISPNGKEEWVKGNNYTIQWDQEGLEVWGDEATICLEGTDIEGNIILPKEKREELCFFYRESYLVDETVLTGNTYQWVIPGDISEKFEEPPDFYKINLNVFDSRVYEEIPESPQWEGLIAEDNSDGYFRIVGIEKGI